MIAAVITATVSSEISSTVSTTAELDSVLFSTGIDLFSLGLRTDFPITFPTSQTTKIKKAIPKKTIEKPRTA